MPKQYHVQAVETAADGEFSPARELLPWADPYIAQLMGQLEDEADDDAWDFDTRLEEEDDDFVADDSHDAELDVNEDWHLDREPRLPAVYGGWPLLNDLPMESISQER